MSNILKSILIIFFLISSVIIWIDTAEAVGLCGSCNVDADCDSGLQCIREKCRGCPTGPGVILCNPIQACDIEELLENIINYIFYFASAVVPILIIVGGFLFMTSAGDPPKLGRAKRLILYTIIGYAIILFSKGFVEVIKGIIGG